MILNRLDNTDKHRLLQPAFVYLGAERGLEPIEICDAAKVVRADNAWNAGQPLGDGTLLARFMVRGDAREALRVRVDAPIGFATGEVGATRVGYTDLITRVRGIADQAAALIDKSHS